MQVGTKKTGTLSGLVDLVGPTSGLLHWVEASNVGCSKHDCHAAVR